jgi:demethylmenaquinone methyltransferase/2-methoxy-6-polyprenyl-1,4-benzoquinol methylase
VKAYYEARAREYDDWWLGRGRFADRVRPGWDQEVEQLTSAIANLPPARTLDVACGTGFLTRHLRGDVVALDQSESMLEIAREQVPHATFVRGDALDLPFEDGAFDRLFASYFYCHLEEEERERFLREARRVAGELVLVASQWREGERPARYEERVLGDGSRWHVYKRVFVPEELLAELGGGEVVHRGPRYFLVVRSQ